MNARMSAYIGFYKNSRLRSTRLIVSSSLDARFVFGHAFDSQERGHVVIVHISDGLNLLTSAQRNQLAAELSKANLTFCALNCNKMKKVQAAIIAFTPLFAMAGISINGAEYIATQTGGEVVRVHEPEDYGKGLEKVIGDLTSRYALGFALDEQDPDDGRMHRIDVRVKARDSSGKERKLEALARRSYYLPKIQESAKHKEAWKIDDAETLKREILKSEILSPEEKEHIKKY